MDQKEVGTTVRGCVFGMSKRWDRQQRKKNSPECRAFSSDTEMAHHKRQDTLLHALSGSSTADFAAGNCILLAWVAMQTKIEHLSKGYGMVRTAIRFTFDLPLNFKNSGTCIRRRLYTGMQRALGAPHNQARRSISGCRSLKLCRRARCQSLMQRSAGGHQFWREWRLVEQPVGIYDTDPHLIEDPTCSKTSRRRLSHGANSLMPADFLLVWTAL